MTDSSEPSDMQIDCSQDKTEDNYIKPIGDEIINILQLNDNEKKDQIVNSLLENGRQVLVNYREIIPDDKYTAAMNGNDTKLLQLLKKYFEQTWKIQYCSCCQWFSSFLEQYSNEENQSLYENLLARTAEFGNKYLKGFPVLSIVLQLLFEAIDDECLQNSTVFDDLWLTITNEGVRSIKKYADYIIEDVMNEQINNKNSALFQALREYYREPLTTSLQQSGIVNRQNLHDLALNSVTENGWSNGVQVIQGKTTKKSFDKLSEIIRSRQRERSEAKSTTLDNTNTTVISTSAQSLTTDNSANEKNNPESITTSGSHNLATDNTRNANQNNIQTSITTDKQFNESVPGPSYHDNRIELSIMRNCKTGKNRSFQLQDLVQAGELQYINQTLDDITKALVIALNFEHRSFPKFIQECLIPIMYLLKRQQNLDDFFISLTFKYQGSERSPQRANISLKMLVHTLFMCSDIFLQRIIMSLLSKRNPVPFICPAVTFWNQNQQYEFMPAIIHVWDFKRPTILSFGIGPCKGKSTLLNQLFQSTFEQTVDSMYFQQTIDIDFGYSFNPERVLNIADTHGQICQSLLESIHPLFNGFLIQIDSNYAMQQPQALVDYMKILPPNKLRIIIIRDMPLNRNREYMVMIDDLLKQSRLDSSQKLVIYPLINISNTNDRNVLFALKQLREDISSQVKSEPSNTNDRNEIMSVLRRLSKEHYFEYLNRLNGIISPLKMHLLQRDQHQTDQNFPLYVKFQELCKLRQKLKKLDFYGTESENMFGIYEKLNKLENELNLDTNRSAVIKLGKIFALFIDILRSGNTLMSLDLLSTELKSEFLSLGGDKIAGDLTIENSFLSLEVLWRNTIVCYNHVRDISIKKLIKKSYCDYIAAGFPFEIIDGDNLNFQHQFLNEIFKEFERQRILVVSIIGPQNSGKSTLLNYMFGSLFDVREGRCTRGVYGSFVKLAKPIDNTNNIFNKSTGHELSEIDYIMLIDTEGLLSIEKSDNEYDRRLVLFCLAVSHLVIVNMMGDVNETLKDMITLCADSLKQIGVNKVNQPIIHFVLNQKADPNLKNHTEAIERIVRDFKEKELAEVIDINPNTFHTLPSAFKKDRLSNETNSPCFIRTEPDFIQRTQQLCQKIIQSAKSSYGRSGKMFRDSPQWLSTAVIVFDTLQKFPDLTYFKDINERRQDDRIRQHIGDLLSKNLSSSYRMSTISDLHELTENEIRKQFQAKFDVHQNNLDNELVIIFKATNASQRIRERTKQFLKRQITETCNAWCTATIQAHDKKQMEVLVRDGSDDLRKLIDVVIKSGQTMNKQKATEEFEEMWSRKIDSINRTFVPQERLKQAVKFVYGNYNIFEKQSLPSHQYILEQLPTIEKLSAMSKVNLVYASVQAHFAHEICYQRQNTLEIHWTETNTNIMHTLATIDNFNHLNKQILKDSYLASTNHYQDVNNTQYTEKDECSDQAYETPRAKRSKRGIFKRGFDAVTNIVTSVYSVTSHHEQAMRVVYTEPLQLHFIEYVHLTILSELETSPNKKSNILCITESFNKLVQDIVTIVDGNSSVRRPIEVDLIQKIVGLINTTINEINHELIVFKLRLSKHAKSLMHTFILVLLTIFYYDEQKNHFNQQLEILKQEKPSLLTYFISMVVVDAQCDTEAAEFFAKKVNDTVQVRLKRDAQIIITRTLQNQQTLNRKQIQTICDGKLLAAADSDEWLFRYIDAPTDIILEEFQILWSEVKKTINQQLEKEKSRWKNILAEFFHRIDFMLTSLANEGSPVQFIDDIFLASGGDAANNLTNKGQCMVLLLYDYLTGVQIRPNTSYTVFNKQYTLKEKGLKLFEKLPTPSQQLASVVSEIKPNDVSDNNRAAVTSIKSLHGFLQSIMNIQQTIVDTYDAVIAIFEAYDTDQHYNKLLDKVNGCISKCPCCQRPCDVDHTLVKSNPGAEDNLHSCQTGHQLRAMAGIKFEITNEASLYQCEQMTDEKPIVVRGTKKKWSEFKKDHPDWDFDNLIVPDELFKLRGKFLNVWSRIGERLCDKYDMEFVTENTAQAGAKPFHYILLLDASGSMNGSPWANLLDGVKEFLKIRSDSGSFDRITIIVFDSQAQYAYYNEDVKSINLNQINFNNGGTDFGNAFDLVIKTIQETNSQNPLFTLSTNLEYIIIFMSDGQAGFPRRQMQTLSTMKGFINQFWTVALGDTKMSVLEEINDVMDGTFKNIKDSADFVNVYAEIARN